MTQKNSPKFPTLGEQAPISRNLGFENHSGLAEHLQEPETIPSPVVNDCS